MNENTKINLDDAAIVVQPEVPFDIEGIDPTEDAEGVFVNDDGEIRTVN